MVGYNAAFRAALLPKIRGAVGARVVIKDNHGDPIVTFDSHYVKSVEMDTQIDPLCRSLPRETLSVVIYDLDGIWNPNDGTSVMYSIKGNEAIDVALRIMDEDGNWQYGRGSSGWDDAISLHYHLTGLPTYNGFELKLSAVMALSSLTQTFHGLYQLGDDNPTGTLNDVMTLNYGKWEHGLAASVKAAGFRIFWDNFANYPVNDACYIKRTELRDALLQMGVASTSTLFTDPHENIMLTKLGEAHSSVVTADQQTSRPSTDITPQIKNEAVIGHSIDESEEQTEARVVGTIEGVYTAGQHIVSIALSHPIKYNTLTHTATNASAVLSYTPVSVMVTFGPVDPSKEVKIELSAEEIPIKETKYIWSFNNAGNDEETDCTLVSPQTASQVALYRGSYINELRETVKIRYRGDPSIYVNDSIRVIINGRMRVCTVIGAKLSIGTSMSGELTLKPSPDGSTIMYEPNAVVSTAVCGTAICGVDMDDPSQEGIIRPQGGNIE